MSKLSINQYYQHLDRAIQFGKSRNEQSVRTPFLNLLNEYARKLNYEVVAEISVMGTKGAKVRPDGVIKNLWGLDIGLWESKDEKDDIQAEIDAKISKGYPLTNILFEDTQVAVLYQRGQEVGRAPVRDAEKLDSLLADFVAFKSEAVYKFEDAVEKFKADIPAIVEALRSRIAEGSAKNAAYQAEETTFLALCQKEINPDITLADIREMMIQHILTSDIFNKVFDDPDFHRHNTIAAELEKLIGFLFSYAERRNLLHSIAHYYEAINAAAAGIIDHHEKQKFLKVLYENFYKVYNPKAADRLGVVYTPNEIVSFMVRSTDYLLHKHFNKTLADKNVEILDPATGTGTFICEIIEHAIPSHQLDYKFKNELHANEVAILPYYIANLNIEYTFKQKMNYYAEFPNLCFVDTLDNIGALAYEGKQFDMFGGLTSENTARIKRQNSKKISVVIGNPPYNAKQALYNDQNSNRQYKDIDKRIKETYIKHGTAQNQIVVYDMYVRFLRWAGDRIDKNGVLAFVSNNSFINGAAFDGFRKCVQEEFNELYIIDLKGNARTSGEQRRKEGGNVFSDEIRVGVAVYFFVKNEKKEGFNVYYNAIHDYAKAAEKKAYLDKKLLTDLTFERITPQKNNWINLADNDFDSLLPLMDKDVKSGKSEQAVFQLFSSGIKSQRDEWVYDFSKAELEKRMRYFVEIYQQTLSTPAFEDKMKIKWDRELEGYRNRGIQKAFEAEKIVHGIYRPFTKQWFYFDRHFNGMVYQWENVAAGDNKSFWIKSGNGWGFFSLAIDCICDILPQGGSQCLPLYRYENGERKENITDWALGQFRETYKVSENLIGLDGQNRSIEKEDIFHYIYAVLHHPAYRKKYELNLKRDFPRVPFYANFWQWASWGKSLMELHIGYEAATPFALKRVEVETYKVSENLIGLKSPKPKLKADKESGIIELDEQTHLSGIPAAAWDYKLGNRSALEWVLDQYKEKKPSDPTIAERFNTYRFADYKEQVIDLLMRVCTVSVETQRIVGEMSAE